MSEIGPDPISAWQSVAAALVGLALVYHGLRRRP